MGKTKFRMPTAYTILFLLIALVALSTWFIPAGSYDYDAEGVPVTGTYHAVEQSPQGVGAVLQNLTIKGQIVTNGGRGGVVAYADTDSKIYNVHSYLDIDIRAEGSNECGGVIGSLRTDAWIDNCAFYGTITVNCNSGDSYGGVAGYSNNGIISNCANYGELVCKTEWDKCELAGIVGRAKSAFYRLYNCLSVGNISTVAPSPLYMNAIVGKYECSNPSQIVNNYYLEGSTPGCEGNMDDALAAAVDASQLASGAVACKLNGSEFSFDPVWYQNAEEDLYPVLDNTHGLPYTVGENSGSINDDAGFATYRDLLVENIRQNCEQAIATQRETFFATSSCPESGERSSGPDLRRSRIFVRNPSEQIVTDLSSADASALR